MASVKKRSGKGHNCPNCAKNTFHEEGPVRVCSKCGTVGWIGEPGGAGGGKGKKCGHCGKHTLHKIYSTTGLNVRHCSACNTMAISN